MLLGIQIIGLLFGLFMLYLTFLHQKRDEFTVKEGGFWAMIWIVFITLTLFPQIFDPFIKRMRFARMLDFLVVAGFMFLTGIMFYIYSIVRINQNRIEEVVRNVAIAKKKRRP